MAGDKSELKDHLRTHDMIHIPKTGGYYIHPNIMNLLGNTPEFQALPKEKQFRLCNLGAGKRKRPESYNGVKCTMYMSEQQYSENSTNTYVIIRNPRHHVLSQYFHCTESNDHAKESHRMPSLENWLEYWTFLY